MKTDDFIGNIIRARLLRINNSNSMALDDQFIGALSQLQSQEATKSVPIWIIIRNETNASVKLRFYTLYAGAPVTNAFDDNDRVLWDHADEIFNELRDYKANDGVLDEHSYTVDAGQTVLRGVQPKAPKNTDNSSFYPVGLFSPQAATHYQLDPTDILTLGLVPGNG